MLLELPFEFWLYSTTDTFKDEQLYPKIYPASTADIV